MPIKDKIELLTPEERKEFEVLNVKIRKGMCNDEEKSRWVYLDKKVSKERLLNMTPEELKAQQEHDKAWDERYKYMQEHGYPYF